MPELTVVGDGEPAAPVSAPAAVDWWARRDELTRKVADTAAELARIDEERGALVVAQAEGDPAAGDRLAELHRRTAELREVARDTVAAIAVVRGRQEAEARAIQARHREEMRGAIADRLDARVDVAAAIDKLLIALDGLVRRWRALGRSASDIGHNSLGLNADVGVLSDTADEAALWDSVAKGAPVFAEMVNLPRFIPGLDDTHLEWLVVSETRRTSTVRQRVAQAAERERQEAAALAEAVPLERVA